MKTFAILAVVALIGDAQAVQVSHHKSHNHRAPKRGHEFVFMRRAESFRNPDKNEEADNLGDTGSPALLGQAKLDEMMAKEPVELAHNLYENVPDFVPGPAQQGLATAQVKGDADANGPKWRHDGYPRGERARQHVHNIIYAIPPIKYPDPNNYARPGTLPLEVVWPPERLYSNQLANGDADDDKELEDEDDPADPIADDDGFVHQWKADIKKVQEYGRRKQIATWYQKGYRQNQAKNK